MAAKWDQPFDKQQIKIFREMVDAHADTPYDKAFDGPNWLWFSQAVAAMEKGLES